MSIFQLFLVHGTIVVRGILLASLISIGFQARSQNYTLEVLNGYGDGDYAPGDTVHIWSDGFPVNQYFLKWTGDTSCVEDFGEWHTRLVMPAHNLTLEAQFGVLPILNEVGFELIMGAERLKPVYYLLPPINEMTGVVYLFHGTNGNAGLWTSNYEKSQWIKRLYSESYGVIITECEETTADEDFNGDNVHRWNYSFDPELNIDIQNILAISDTMINRGWMLPTSSRYAFGVSAGGTFACTITHVLGWIAGISHHSPGPLWVADNCSRPMRFAMNSHDDHPEVGAEAYYEALSNYEGLLNREVCSDIDLFLQQPLHPVRFMRKPLKDTSGVEVGLAMFIEMKLNGALNSENYLIVDYETIELAAFLQPNNWPIFNSLDNNNRSHIETEIDICTAAHEYHTDFMAQDLRFFANPCDPSSGSDGFTCPSSYTCSGDFNLDGSVGIVDFLQFLGAFNCAQNCSAPDLNGDSLVNTSDLLEFLGYFGTDCP